MRWALVSAALAVAVLAFLAFQAPGWAANALLHPTASVNRQPPPDGCVNATFSGAGVTLRGWRCRTGRTARGLVIYLHGIADNHASARAVASAFLARGFDFVAYDSRAHGDSEGDACTYGFYEKEDLRRVVDALGSRDVVLIGTSLGGAVALQEAAGDKRIAAVVAAETFSDLRTIARERAPSILPAWAIRRAFAIAEQRGSFELDQVSPLHAASQIAAPVLLIHGAADRETTPDHSRRVYDALTGPKRLILVDGAHHNQSLSGDVWRDVNTWIDEALRARTHI